MRVTGGEMAGRKLAGAPAGVRPTADRVRESVFARLPRLEGARVLDLFAGTGTLGIEALSRGAASVVFVERSGASIHALQRNLRALDLTARCDVRRGDVGGVVRKLARLGHRFDLVLADPPYEALGELVAPLAGLVDQALLAPDATLVIERSRRHAVPTVPGLAHRDSRRYGDTIVDWLAVAPAESTGDSDA
ncbi:MAG: 16S rRNA (guanine(966)-N(2))-methyltransferase RsmD [Myxococcota bacterium]